MMAVALAEEGLELEFGEMLARHEPVLLAAGWAPVAVAELYEP
jgi:hypothetical protein